MHTKTISTTFMAVRISITHPWIIMITTMQDWSPRKSATQNGTLGLLLAIIAVVGGGAAWKFYTQYSEQKHEQKMKQMDLQAKANGLAGAQPPPCQTANAKIQAELKEMKAKLANVDKKLALTADFDADLLERKVKKIERRLRDLEEDKD